MGTQQTPTSQSNPKQKEQGQTHHNNRFQIILQSNTNKNSIVLAKKQTHRPMEQNGGHINNMCNQLILYQKSKNMYGKKDSLSLTNGAGKTGYPLVED